MFCFLVIAAGEGTCQKTGIVSILYEQGVAAHRLLSELRRAHHRLSGAGAALEA